MGESAIPADERSLVLSGTPASQLFSISGTPQLVIGVPLPAVHAAYFEVFSLDELAGTLRTLAFALAAAALVTTLAGAALGRWASGRALRPLAGVTDAAVAIAGGQLDTRVEAGDDVDLQELASAFNRMAAQPPGPHRAGSSLHLRRQPRAPVPSDHPVGDGRRPRGPPRRAGAPGTERVRPARRGPPALHPDGGRPAGDLAGSMPARPSSRSTRSTRENWCSGLWPPLRRSGSTVTGPRHFPVEIDPGVEGLRLRVDKRRFERVMANLVENASLYAGGVTRVIVERHPSGSGGSATQEHPGHRRGPWTGDPPSTSATTSSNASTGAAGPGQRASSDGTGLGLSLVAEHVRLHGGAVWIEDAPGRGSRFVVELPLSPERVRPSPSMSRGDRRPSPLLAVTVAARRALRRAASPPPPPRQPSPSRMSPSICSTRSPRPRWPRPCPRQWPCPRRSSWSHRART